MDRQFVMELLSLLVGGLGVFLTYRQLQLMEIKAAKRSSGNLRGLPTVVVLAVLTVLNFSLWLTARWERPQAPTLGVAGWGGAMLSEKEKALFITAISTQDDPTHRMMAIAYHYAADIDVGDLKDLQKSALFDIRKGVQQMLIKLDDKFVNEANSGKHFAANYSLLIIPRQAERDEVTTLRRLAELGGKVVWSGQGPP
jgi:hypothetical protein